MLAATFPSYSRYTQYMPARPSPLSPRSGNANFRPLFPHKMSDSSSHSRESTPGAQSKPSQRTARPNPLIKSSEERARLRRKAFLDRIADARDDQRWERRSDQILRSDYLAEQRRWEQERNQSAPSFADEDDQENELPVASHEAMTFEQHGREYTLQNHTLSDEVEAVVNQEEGELQELLALAEEDEDQNIRGPESERWGSDEEDYDSLFTEYLSSQQAPQQDTAHAHDVPEDSMDTSTG